MCVFIYREGNYQLEGGGGGRPARHYPIPSKNITSTKFQCYKFHCLVTANGRTVLGKAVISTHTVQVLVRLSAPYPTTL